MKYYYIVFSITAINGSNVVSIKDRMFYKTKDALNILALEIKALERFKSYHNDNRERQLMNGLGPLSAIIENYIEMTEEDYRTNTSEKDW